MPSGTPRYIRCHDSGPGDFDRFTVVFTLAHRWGGKQLCGFTEYRGMSAHPCSPQGVGQWGELPPGTRGNFGKRITFNGLPADCRELVLRDYREIWGLA